MSSFQEKLQSNSKPIFTYGITPPKLETEKEKIKQISAFQIDRLKDLPLDALVVYDIQDEADRTQQDRPFPFMETLDNVEYVHHYLSELNIPKILYRSVGKYDDLQLKGFLSDISRQNNFCIFVGAAAQKQKVKTSLREAYSIYQKYQHHHKATLGGVCIPERHKVKNNEHLKILNKIESKCQFFVSQGIYNIQSCLDMLSDYYYHCRNNELEMKPIIFTLTPCGSLKTLDFMRWLGISIPKWLHNDLTYSRDILMSSIEACLKIWNEISVFAKAKGIPIGCNVESVAIRKTEIEASIEIFNKVVISD